MKQELKWAAAALVAVAAAALTRIWLLTTAMSVGANITSAEARTAVSVSTAARLEPKVRPVPTTEQVPDPALVEQLAILIYREAGGDTCCDDCRIRVADVALNRVADERFPGTLEAVLTQKKQYGTMYWDGVTWPERAENPEEAGAVTRARETAEAVLSGTHSELYGNGYIFQSEFPNLGDDEGRVTCCGIYFAKG